MKDFLKKVAEVLELEGLNETDDLNELEQWDSLAKLSIIAMVDADYGVNLQAADIKQVNTAGKLWSLIKSKKSLNRESS